MSNPFWHYSLAVYGQEDIASACLELQALFDMDVNLLLYGAWMAANCEVLDSQHLRAVDERVEQWRTDVVRAIRALRSQFTRSDNHDDIYQRIKALELEAEQRQQEMMFAFYSTSSVQRVTFTPMRQNLLCVAQLSAADSAHWQTMVERLADRIALLATR